MPIGDGNSPASITKSFGAFAVRLAAWRYFHSSPLLALTLPVPGLAGSAR